MTWWLAQLLSINDEFVARSAIEAGVGSHSYVPNWIGYTIVNSLAILCLCYYAYSQIDSQLHMWDMFQDFERLLIEILTGRMETKDV